MNKQSVILTKWVADSNALLEDHSQLGLLMFDNEWDMEIGVYSLGISDLEELIANSDRGTKFKLTLEKVEDENT